MTTAPSGRVATTSWFSYKADNAEARTPNREKVGSSSGLSMFTNPTLGVSQEGDKRTMWKVPFAVEYLTLWMRKLSCDTRMVFVFVFVLVFIFTFGFVLFLVGLG